VPRKGVDNAIRALGLLGREHGLAPRLLVVGGSDRVPDPTRLPELARLMAIADEEGVLDRVEFVGRRDRAELAAYYNAADIFVTTPWYEPFGITPLEAMACGTPVIGSNVGGIKFSVRDGETGYLVPPNDPAALAERIAHLYRHPKLLALLGRQAIRRVNDLFTWDRVATGIADVYEEVVRVAELSEPDASDRRARDTPPRRTSPEHQVVAAEATPAAAGAPRTQRTQEVPRLPVHRSTAAARRPGGTRR